MSDDSSFVPDRTNTTLNITNRNRRDALLFISTLSSDHDWDGEIESEVEESNAIKTDIDDTASEAVVAVAAAVEQINPFAKVVSTFSPTSSESGGVERRSGTLLTGSSSAGGTSAASDSRPSAATSASGGAVIQQGQWYNPIRGRSRNHGKAPTHARATTQATTNIMTKQRRRASLGSSNFETILEDEDEDDCNEEEIIPNIRTIDLGAQTGGGENSIAKNNKGNDTNDRDSQSSRMHHLAMTSHVRLGSMSASIRSRLLHDSVTTSEDENDYDYASSAGYQTSSRYEYKGEDYASRLSGYYSRRRSTDHTGTSADASEGYSRRRPSGDTARTTSSVYARTGYDGASSRYARSSGYYSQRRSSEYTTTTTSSGYASTGYDINSRFASVDDYVGRAGYYSQRRGSDNTGLSSEYASAAEEYKTDSRYAQDYDYASSGYASNSSGYFAWRRASDYTRGSEYTEYTTTTTTTQSSSRSAKQCDTGGAPDTSSIRTNDANKESFTTFATTSFTTAPTVTSSMANTPYGKQLLNIVKEKENETDASVTISEEQQSSILRQAYANTRLAFHVPKNDAVQEVNVMYFHEGMEQEQTEGGKIANRPEDYCGWNQHLGNRMYENYYSIKEEEESKCEVSGKEMEILSIIRNSNQPAMLSPSRKHHRYQVYLTIMAAFTLVLVVVAMSITSLSPPSDNNMQTTEYVYFSRQLFGFGGTGQYGGGSGGLIAGIEREKQKRELVSRFGGSVADVNHELLFNEEEDGVGYRPFDIGSSRVRQFANGGNLRVGGP